MSRDRDKLLMAQAKVGLEALIDEATGYQKVREKDALRKRYSELGGDYEPLGALYAAVYREPSEGTVAAAIESHEQACALITDALGLSAQAVAAVLSEGEAT